MSEEAHVSLYKYTDQAGDLLPIFEGVSGVALYQVQIRAQLVGFFDIFYDFLRSGDYPNLQELSLQAGIKLVLTRRDDPDMVGFVPWRIAFYVAGSIDSLNNFLMLLDDFWIYLAKNGRVYEVHMHPHINVNIYSEDFSYGRYIMNDPTNNELSCGD